MSFFTSSISSLVGFRLKHGPDLSKVHDDIERNKPENSDQGSKLISINGSPAVFVELVENPPVVRQLLLGQPVVLLLGRENIDRSRLGHLGSEHLLETREPSQRHTVEVCL